MLNLEDRIKKFNEMMNKYIPTEFINWLEYNGFFTAPASTKYHGNYEGGLFDHSYSVAETLKQLSKANRLKWNNLRSPFVIGMFHDLCKIDN
jgi:23S rRNA maturation-related 3'-5' exoribonuclease YhaM